MRRGGGGKRGGIVCSGIRVPELNAPARASRCTFRKRHQGTLSGALRSEARRERSAREGGFPCRSAGRCAPARSSSEAERVSARLSEAHVRKTRPPPHSTPARKGGIVRSDIRVPEAKRGRVPCRNEDDTCLSKARSVQNQAEPCIPCRTREHERGAASHTGDSASFVRTGSAEKLSLPHRTQPESAHARGRRQPDRGWPS